ncbi:MAG: L-rhamnose mutarotase [Tepidisphaeraceae bacterium]
MQRVGFMLRVRPDRIEEYRRLHNPIWPELTAALRDAGMQNYTLWLAPDGTEFGYLECHDWAAVCAHLADHPVHVRWQAMMRDFLLSDQDAAQGGQPVTRLENVFRLDA